jgi:hypothetical protein
MRSICWILLVPTVMSGQVLRFAGPAGSASNPGSRVSPWNITRALSSCSNDTTIILLDGVYIQDSTATWGVGTGSGRSRLIADPGARPFFTRRNNQAPRFFTGGNTTVQGIWFGGRGINDSIGFARGHGSARMPTTGDSIISCVFFNTWDSGISTGHTKLVIKNCLFVNAGMKSDEHYHGVYLSGQASSRESSLVTYRNVFITTDPNRIPSQRSKWSSHGYSLHYWHNPKYARIQKNFTTYWAVHQGRDVVLRDNVFWQGGIQFTPMEGIAHDSAAADTPHVWRRNIIVKDVDVARREYFTWPDPIAERGNPAFPEVMWWNGDSTWLSNQWIELGQGYVRKNGVIKHPRSFAFPGDVPSLLGMTAAGVDTAIARLGRSFYDRTAQAVRADTTILSNWQKLFDVVDFWQGTREERVDLPGNYVSVPVHLTRGWNLISKPVETAIDSLRQLYPAASVPFAFEYSADAGYVPRYTISAGKGYCVKFTSPVTASLWGVRVRLDSIRVGEGWNLIGSLTDPVDTASVRTSPPGLRSSMYFGYEGQYAPADTIEPGHAYWVKSAGPGAFILRSDSSTAGAAP